MIEIGTKIYQFRFIHDGSISLKDIKKEELVIIGRGRLVGAGDIFYDLVNPNTKPSLYDSSICLHKDELNRYSRDFDSVFLLTDDIQMAQDLYRNYLEPILEEKQANIKNTSRQIEMFTQSIERDKKTIITLEKSLETLENLGISELEELQEKD